MRPHFLAYVVLAVISAGLIVGGGCSDPSEQLDSPDALKRLEAIRALEKQGGSAAAEGLAKAAGHEDAMTARAAVLALSAINHPSALASLKEVVASDPRGSVRALGVVALARAARDAAARKEAAEVMRRVVRGDQAAMVRAEAAGALGKVGSVEDVDLLVEVTGMDRSKVVISRAAGAVDRLLGVKFRYDPTAPREKREERLRVIREVAPAIARKRARNPHKEVKP